VGYTVFYVQEMDADGDPDTFAGTLTAVAARVRAIATKLAGDRLVMLDLHLEEGDAPRGVFTIVPDDPASSASGRGDVWKNNAHAVRLGHLIAENIALRAGFVQRNAKELGVMSERQTGVGETGSRLGMFGGTAALRTRMARLIVEHGNIVKDLAIIDDPQTPARCAAAVVDALATYFMPPPTIA
jgi:N-acetylmuramoyl-L-alanine amidase